MRAQQKHRKRLLKVVPRSTIDFKDIMATTQGIKLDDHTRSRLKALAEKRQRTPHWIMRTAIEEYLQREEKYEQEKDEDLARWEEYLLTGQAADHQEVQAWLNNLSKGKNKPWAPK